MKKALLRLSGVPRGHSLKPWSGNDTDSSTMPPNRCIPTGALEPRRMQLRGAAADAMASQLEAAPSHMAAGDEDEDGGGGGATKAELCAVFMQFGAVRAVCHCSCLSQTRTMAGCQDAHSRE